MKSKKLSTNIFEFVLLFVFVAVFLFIVKNWGSLSKIVNHKVNNSINSEVKSDKGEINAEGDGFKGRNMIYIPSIEVKAPIVWDVDDKSESNILENLKHGIVRLPQSGYPDDEKEIILIGHSSGVTGNIGDYDDVFSLISELKNGDLITINYQGEIFNYNMFDRKIIKAKIDYNQFLKDESTLNLVTCWPIGTNFKRLIVIAK